MHHIREVMLFKFYNFLLLTNIIHVFYKIIVRNITIFAQKFLSEILINFRTITDFVTIYKAFGLVFHSRSLVMKFFVIGDIKIGLRIFKAMG